MKIIKKLWDQQIVRFMLVGGFNTIIDTSVLLALVKVAGLPELVANSLSVSVAITVSYILNHKIVFRHNQNYSFANYLRFFAVTGFGIIAIQDVIIYIVMRHLWVLSDASLVTLANHQIAAKTVELIGSKLSAVVIVMLWNFLLYKYVIFKGKPVDQAEELTLA